MCWNGHTSVILAVNDNSVIIETIECLSPSETSFLAIARFQVDIRELTLSASDGRRIISLLTMK